MHYLTISYHPLPLPRPWQQHLCTAGQQNGKNATGAAHSLAKDTFSCPVHSASDSFSASVLLYHIPSALVRQAHYEELSGGHAPDNNHPEEER